MADEIVGRIALDLSAIQDAPQIVGKAVREVAKSIEDLKNQGEVSSRAIQAAQAFIVQSIKSATDQINIQYKQREAAAKRQHDKEMQLIRAQAAERMNRQKLEANRPVIEERVDASRRRTLIAEEQQADRLSSALFQLQERYRALQSEAAKLGVASKNLNITDRITDPNRVRDEINSVRNLTSALNEQVRAARSVQQANREQAAAARELANARREYETLAHGARMVGREPEAPVPDSADITATAQAQRELNEQMRQANRDFALAAKSSEQYEANLIRARYAIHDVANTVGIAGAALAGLSAIAIKTSGDYEQAFTFVARATEAPEPILARMRKEFEQLGLVIPKTFEGISEVGGFGAQLGVADQHLTRFTDIVAKFSQVTGVAEEESAKNFGRITNLLDVSIAELPALADSLAKSGVEAAATEQEILAVTNQIAAFTRQAGIGADYTVGLATAMGSLRIPPELARSGIQRLVAVIDRLAESGGPRLNEFARLIGVTADEAAQLWRSDPEQFFTRFLNGMNAAFQSGENFTRILDDLGIMELRARTVLTRLGQNAQLVGESLQMASDSWGSGFLDEAASRVFDTFNSKLQIFQNSIRNFLASGAQPLVDVLKIGLDWLTGLVAAFGELPPWLTSTTIATTALVGILGVAFALFGRIVGSVLAFRTATRELATATPGATNLISSAFTTMANIIIGDSRRAQVAVQQLKATMATPAGTTVAATSNILAQPPKKGMGGLARTAAGGGLMFAGIAGQMFIQDMLAEQVANGMEEGAKTGGQRMLSVVSNTLTGAGIGMLAGPIGAGVGAAIGAVVTGISELVGYSKDLRDAEFTIERIKELMPFLNEGDIGEEQVKLLNEQLRNTRDLLDNISKQKFTLTPEQIELEETMGINYAEVNATRFAGDLNKAQKELVEGVKQGHIAARDFINIVKEIDTVARDVLSDQDYSKFDTAIQSAYDHLFSLRWEQGEFERLAQTGGGFDELTEGATDYASALDELGLKLSNAVEGTFSLANAEMALNSALSSLGAGVAESTDFSMFTDEGRQNITNYQNALMALADLVETRLRSGMVDAADATKEFEQGLNEINSLVGPKGLTRELQELAQNVIPEIANILDSAALEQAQVELQARIDTDALASDIEGIELALERLGADIEDLSFTPVHLLDANPSLSAAEDEINQFLDRTAERLNVPRELVIDALTKPGEDKIQALLDATARALSKPGIVKIDADTTAAANKLNSFIRQAARMFQGLPLGIGGTINRIAERAIEIVGSSASTASNIPFTFGRIAESANLASEATKSFQDGYNNQLEKMAKNTKGAADKTKREADKLKREQERLAKEAAKAAEEFAKSQEEAFKEAIEYAENYHNRLREVLTRAQYATYASANATDQYFTSANSLASVINNNIDRVRSLSESMAGYRDSIQDVLDKQRELRADAAKDRAEARKAEIERDIAIRYGDTDRVNQYSAEYDKHIIAAEKKERDAERAEKEVAKLNKQIADAREEITKLMADRYALSGYSEQAIANRKAVQQLQTDLINMLAVYAESGKTQAQVAKYAEELANKFELQMKSLGFASEDVKQYAEEFRRVMENAQKVPKEVNVKTNKTPVEELNYQLRGTKRLIDEINGMSVNVAVSNIDVPHGAQVPKSAPPKQGTARTDNTGKLKTYTLAKGESIATVAAMTGLSIEELRRYNNMTGKPGEQGVGKTIKIPKYNEGGPVPGTPPANPFVDNILAASERGALYAIRSHEFIMREQAHKYYGTDFMNMINQMKIPRRATGGSVSTQYAGTLGSLQPSDLRELATVMERAVARGASEGISNTPIIINDDTIARSNAKGTANLRRKGELP